MRHLAPAAIAALALTAVALPATTSVASTTLKCGVIHAPTGDTGPVTASGTTCKVARVVAQRSAVYGRNLAGWRCTATPYQGGASVVCKKKTGTARVKYQIAD